MPAAARAAGVISKMLFVASSGSVVALLDPLHPGREHHREREVRVARRVRRAELDAGARLVVALRVRHAHEGRLVVARPRDVGGRLVPGDEALVGVHGLVGDRGDLARVAQQPGDEVLARLRQARLVARVVERVDVALEEREVRVQAGAERALDRLGHERGVHAELARDALHHHAERHHVVGHRQRVGVAQVDLVLARTVLVERVLDGDAHRLEREDRAAAELVGLVGVGEVEEAGVVERDRIRGRLEVEVLDLGAGEERVPVLARLLEVAAQHDAGVAVERLAGERADVAEHAGDRGVVAPPGDDLERGGVGHGEHVRLLDPGVPLDRGAVEAHALLERALELGRRDGEALERAEHVGEPELDEAHAALLHGAQDVLELRDHRMLQGAGEGAGTGAGRCGKRRPGTVYGRSPRLPPPRQPGVTQRSHFGNGPETAVQKALARRRRTGRRTPADRLTVECPQDHSPHE